MFCCKSCGAVPAVGEFCYACGRCWDCCPGSCINNQRLGILCPYCGQIVDPQALQCWDCGGVIQTPGENVAKRENPGV